MNDNFRGAAIMVASMACFVANDTVMKGLSDQMEWYQALALRGPFAIGLIVAVALAVDGRRSLRTVASYAGNGPTLLRIGAEIGSTTFFLLALFAMPLANVTAITLVLPLLLTVGGVVFFAEPVGWRRWVATAVGFGGVLLIVQPGSEGFNFAAIYALISVSFMAVRDLSTKTVPRAIPSTYLTGLTNVAVFAFACAFTAPAGLPSFDGWTLAALALSAVFITFGFLLLILATRIGAASFTAPFRYSILLWALLAGLVVFDQVPGPLQLLGAMIVVGAGLYTFARERRSLRNEATASASRPVSAASQSRNA